MPDIMSLDRTSTVPLHTQAELALRGLVADRAHQQGALLPDELTLAAQLGVSRNTLRTAMARLVAEGLLERKQGVGTRVRKTTASSPLGAWVSFTRDMARKGIEVQSFEEVVERLRVPEPISRILEVPAHAFVLQLDRVRGWHGMPTVLFRSYLHPRLGLEPWLDFSGSLSDLLYSRCHIRPASSDQEITAVEAEPWVAKGLMVPEGTPLLLRKRKVFDPHGNVIEYGLDYIRTDRFSLTLRLDA